MSTSICLVRAWETGLEAKDSAPELSHQRVGGDGREKWEVVRKELRAGEWIVGQVERGSELLEV
jgi:hypothetical protein